jgi:four helix bundle protein
MASIKHFRDLRAWQQCRVVRQRIRLLVKGWPAEEKFRLTDQIIRSSRGPTSHIAEGYGRFHEKDNARFCRIARGSLYETQDHLITAHDEGLIDGTALNEYDDLIEGTIRTVNAYIKYLTSMSGGGQVVSEPVAIYGAHQALEEPPLSARPLDADI